MNYTSLLMIIIMQCAHLTVLPAMQPQSELEKKLRQLEENKDAFQKTKLAKDLAVHVQKIINTRDKNAIYATFVALIATNSRSIAQLIQPFLELPTKTLNINTADLDNLTTPLMIAARSGHPETISVLIDNGADLTLKNAAQKTALELASDETRTTLEKYEKLIALSETLQGKEITEMLAKKEATQDDLTTALFAILFKSTEDKPNKIDALIARGALLNMQTSTKLNPLMLALSKEFNKIALRIAQSSKPDELNDTDNNGLTPLDYALLQSTPSRALIETLLQKGARPVIVGQKNSLPTLAYALARKSFNEDMTAVITQLLSYRADVNLLSSPERTTTPLFFLLEQDPDKTAIKIIDLLLSRGADINALSAAKNTVLDITKNSDLRKALTDRGAKTGAECAANPELCKADDPLKMLVREFDILRQKLIMLEKILLQ